MQLFDLFKWLHIFCCLKNDAAPLLNFRINSFLFECDKNNLAVAEKEIQFNYIQYLSQNSY